MATSSGDIHYPTPALLQCKIVGYVALHVSASISTMHEHIATKNISLLRGQQHLTLANSQQVLFVYRMISICLM